ncbi:MAG: hypothetical protein ACRDZ7_18340, partial [Acidimicrobiia bacterium]
MVDGRQLLVGDRGDGEDHAVVKALPAGADGSVDQDAVAGAVAALPASPGGTGQFRSLEVAGGSQAQADAVGEVFAVGVSHGQRHHLVGPIGGDVGGDGVGQGFAGGVGGAEVVFPALPGADRLAHGNVAGPVVGQRL